jgi:hypothetical protein
MTWQPIETAPKDGTHFLGARMYFGAPPWTIVVMHHSVHDLENGKLLVSWDHDDEFRPTHWMPLPDPPA